jgi:hypothetical protein
VRAALVLACALAGILVVTPDVNAAGECEGLDVCIPVAGPWVAIPAPTGAARLPSVVYQLDCPRNSVVGGLDARVTERAVDVVFLGRLGSPVNPGITTGRSAVFVATFTAAARRATGFRPFIGCIPTSGGGGRGTTSVGAVAPGEPALRRIRMLRVRPGERASATLRCAAAERLVASSHAVAFRIAAQPPASVLSAVSVTRRERGNSVFVTARRTEAVPPSVRVDVQIHAICARRGR